MDWVQLNCQLTMKIAVAAVVVAAAAAVAVVVVVVVVVVVAAAAAVVDVAAVAVAVDVVAFFQRARFSFFLNYLHYHLKCLNKPGFWLRWRLFRPPRQHWQH